MEILLFFHHAFVTMILLQTFISFKFSLISKECQDTYAEDFIHSTSPNAKRHNIFFLHGSTCNRSGSNRCKFRKKPLTSRMLLCRYRSSIICNTTCSSPALNAGLPKYGHDAHRNASPKLHLPQAELGAVVLFLSA